MIIAGNKNLKDQLIKTIMLTNAVHPHVYQGSLVDNSRTEWVELDVALLLLVLTQN